jgi:hypothetical protein
MLDRIFMSISDIVPVLVVNCKLPVVMKPTSMKIFSSSSLRSVLRMNYLIRQNISANDLISKTKLNRTTLNSKAFATQSCRQKEIEIVGDSVSGKIKNDQIKVLHYLYFSLPIIWTV